MHRYVVYHSVTVRYIEIAQEKRCIQNNGRRNGRTNHGVVVPKWQFFRLLCLDLHLSPYLGYLVYTQSVGGTT